MIPEVRNAKPPPGAGSGKFGTPWDRMQSAYLTPSVYVLEMAALVGLFEEPQAAITIAQVMAAPATSGRWQRLRTGVHNCRRALSPFGLAIDQF